jgi:hypothetical protein
MYSGSVFMGESLKLGVPLEALAVNGLSEWDSAAIIREVRDAYGEDMPACCPDHQQVRYQLLDVAPVREQLYAVRILRIPLDRQGRAVPAKTTAPSFVLARAGSNWELVGRRFPD